MPRPPTRSSSATSWTGTLSATPQGIALVAFVCDFVATQPHFTGLYATADRLLMGQQSDDSGANAHLGTVAGFLAELRTVCAQYGLTDAQTETDHRHRPPQDRLTARAPARSMRNSTHVPTIIETGASTMSEQEAAKRPEGEWTLAPAGTHDSPWGKVTVDAQGKDAAGTAWGLFHNKEGVAYLSQFPKHPRNFAHHLGAEYVTPDDPRHASMRGGSLALTLAKHRKGKPRHKGD